MSGIQTVLLVVYLLIVLALIGVILLQRSEGGGLGMGGNAGGLMTVRGSANLLTRTTAILAALFFATAIGLTILSEIDRGPTQGILDAAGASTSDVSAPSNVLDALSQLQGDTSSVVEAPASASASTDPGLALPATSSAPASASAPASSDATASSSVAPSASASTADTASSAPTSASAPPSSASAPAASTVSSASAQ